MVEYYYPGSLPRPRIGEPQLGPFSLKNNGCLRMTLEIATKVEGASLIAELTRTVPAFGVISYFHSVFGGASLDKCRQKIQQAAVVVLPNLSDFVIGLGMCILLYRIIFKTFESPVYSVMVGSSLYPAAIAAAPT